MITDDRYLKVLHTESRKLSKTLSSIQDEVIGKQYNQEFRQNFYCKYTGIYIREHYIGTKKADIFNANIAVLWLDPSTDIIKYVTYGTLNNISKSLALKKKANSERCLDESFVTQKCTDLVATFQSMNTYDQSKLVNECISLLKGLQGSCSYKLNERGIWERSHYLPYFDKRLLEHVETVVQNIIQEMFEEEEEAGSVTFSIYSEYDRDMDENQFYISYFFPTNPTLSKLKKIEVSNRKLNSLYESIKEYEKLKDDIFKNLQGI